MKKKATFSREQLSKSKTFGYGKDLVLAVLEDRDYTKDEAEKEIQAYLTGEREGFDMALGGGTFMTQNKVLPGAYIYFVSDQEPWAVWVKEAWSASGWSWTGAGKA